MQDDPIKKVREQFDAHPYPGFPLEDSPVEETDRLYSHNIVTSRYLRDETILNPQGMTILDAGCGAGYNSLVLAIANPGARIVGIDLSAKSIEVARARMAHHGFQNCEFHNLAMDNLATLQMQFDYINCDEMLYLTPDPASGLSAMKSVLKQD